MAAPVFCKMLKRIFVYLLLVSLLSACVLTGPEPAPVSESEWWKDAIFYEIFVRSFYDTNDDGVGDFNGVTAKLDYLQELGITAIWLMPVHPSPSYHGYDVINYYAVNHEYGTLDDFKHLLDEAHKRDMRVIIDLVINHTSSLHPFFVDANNNPDSAYRNWYVWADEWQGNGWHQGQQGFYYGLFWEGMPDLNYNNPEVTDFANRISEYWLNEIGVDGFRVDAAKHLIEQNGQTENTPATHDWYKDYYVTYKDNYPDAYTVGEVFGAGAFIATTYQNEFDHIFNFELASGIINSVSGESNTGINSALKFTLRGIADGDYATFLTNHDQNRIMSVLNGDVEKAKLAAFMLLTTPGTPFIYYGEEIGMLGVKPDEDIRLPMQWSGEENAGFSGSKPWRNPDANYPQVNVALQDNDPNSLLSHYRELIQLRKAHSALRTGSTILLETGNSGIYAILRRDGAGNLLILVNLTRSPISEYALTLQEEFFADGTITPETMFGNDQGEQVIITNKRFKDYKPLGELPPYHAYIFQLK